MAADLWDWGWGKGVWGGGVGGPVIQLVEQQKIMSCGTTACK